MEENDCYESGVIFQHQSSSCRVASPNTNRFCVSDVPDAHQTYSLVRAELLNCLPHSSNALVFRRVMGLLAIPGRAAKIAGQRARGNGARVHDLVGLCACGCVCVCVCVCV
jgi:hypothetical protein